MQDDDLPGKRQRREPKPLDPARLEELALAYVARFSTSAAKLERYLRRKVRERGWSDDADPPLAPLVARFADLGYIDDEGYARMKSGSLLRRGYGARRVNQALCEAGIAEDLRSAVAPDERAERQAALSYARRRRLGPFGDRACDPASREKQLAAMVRAGHGFEAARALVQAPSIAEAEQWAAELDETDEW